MRIGKLSALLVALVAGLVALTPHAVAAFEPGVAYVSGLEMGKRKTALLRMSANASSSYIVTVVAYAEDGNLLATYTDLSLPLGRTVEFDIGNLVNARRLAQNPNAAGFAGSIKLRVSAVGGFDINPFGRHTVAVEGIQKIGKTPYRAAVDWR